MTKIDKKIIGYQVVGSSAPEKESPTPEPVKPWVRPDRMDGETIKVSIPNEDHAMYLTVNCDQGTRRPREMFLYTKNPEHYLLTSFVPRAVSAVLRHEGDYEFIFREMMDSFDPKGGFFVKGKFMPSIVAYLGHILMDLYGKKPEVDPYVAEFIAKKKAEVAAPTDYPEHATVCTKCSTKAVVKMDGCEVCLSCGASHCS